MAGKLGKRATSLIALGVAAVLLVGAYLLIKFLPGEAEETPAPMAENIVLYECEKEDIIGFTLDSLEGVWSVDIDRQEKTITKDDGTTDTETETAYTLKGYPDIPVNEGTVGDVLTNVSKLLAVNVVEQETPADLSPYGLDPAVVTATVRMADGSSVEFYLGYKTGAGNSYYMMKQGDPAVYEVKLTYGNRFSYTMVDLVNMDVLPVINTVALERLSLKREGQPDIEATRFVTPEDQAQIGVSGFKVVSPFIRPKDIDAEELDALLNNIAAIRMSGIASLDGGQKDQYGLLVPWMELNLSDGANTLHIYFGDDYDDDQVCCVVEGYTPIYTVDKASIAFLEAVQASNLGDKFLLLPMIDDVEQVDITIDDREYSLTIERRTEKAEDEGEEDKVVETYFLNGEQKNEGPFKEAYQAAIGVTADAYNDDPALTEGETVATITYSFNVADTPSMTVSYHAYDVDFYAGALESDTQALVAKKKVEKIAAALTALEESEYTED